MAKTLSADLRHVITSIPGHSTKKSKARPKGHPLSGGTAAIQQTGLVKSTEISESNSRAVSRRKQEGKKTGPPVRQKLTSRQQTGIEPKQAPARRQKRATVKSVEPIPEPQVEAEALPGTSRDLSVEAQELLAKVDEGGIPLMITRNLERIAAEHGISVGGDMTPNDLVRLLRNLA
jgi:hypothetical protein